MSDIIVVGSFVQDLAFRTKLFPAPGETRIGTFKAGPGGKGFNQAIAASRSGAKTSFIGAAGDDGFARDLKLFLNEESLDAYLETIPGQATGAASIVVNESGQNLIVVALGASDHLSPAFIQKQSGLFKKAKIVVTQLECNLDATRAALKLGRDCGAKVILNPAPINSKVDSNLIEMADILVPNETEAEFLANHLHGIPTGSGVSNASDRELEQLARRLSPHTVIITLGSGGSFVSPPEAPPFRVPAIKVNVVDSTGAGDAFTGGLATGLLNYPDSLRKAVEFATVVAGMSTEREGTAPAMPHIDEISERWRT